MAIPTGLLSYTARQNRQLGPYKPGEGYWVGDQFIFNPAIYKAPPPPPIPVPDTKPTPLPGDDEDARRRIAALEAAQASRAYQFEGDSGGHAGDPDFGTASPGGNEAFAGMLGRAVMGAVSPVGTGLLTGAAINSSEAARSEKASLANSAYNDDMMAGRVATAPPAPQGLPSLPTYQAPEAPQTPGVNDTFGFAPGDKKADQQYSDEAGKAAPNAAVQSGPTSAQMAAAQEGRKEAEKAFRSMTAWAEFMRRPTVPAPFLSPIASPVAPDYLNAAVSPADIAAAQQYGYNENDLGYGIGAAPGGIGVTGPTEYNGPQVSDNFSGFGTGAAFGNQDYGQFFGGGDDSETGPGDTDASGNSFRKGGPTPNDGDKKLEAVPIMAHEGEYVIRPEAVKHYGTGLLSAINKRKIDRKKAHGLLSR